MRRRGTFERARFDRGKLPQHTAAIRHGLSKPNGSDLRFVGGEPAQPFRAAHERVSVNSKSLNRADRLRAIWPSEFKTGPGPHDDPREGAAEPAERGTRSDQQKTGATGRAQLDRRPVIPQNHRSCDG